MARKAKGEAKTTVTPGGYHRKTAYFLDEEWQKIRWEAFEDDVTYADVIRRAVRQYFEMDEGGQRKKAKAKAKKKPRGR